VHRPYRSIARRERPKKAWQAAPAVSFTRFIPCGEQRSLARLPLTPWNSPGKEGHAQAPFSSCE
jgi:hypothetical protein